jgi:hypothetical protein
MVAKWWMKYFVFVRAVREGIESSFLFISKRYIVGKNE